MSFQRSGTFTHDQLQKFGLAGKESPPVPTVPPPAFPLLDFRPVELEEDDKGLTYKLLWLNKFQQAMRDSSNNIKLKEEEKPLLPLRYSELVKKAKVKVVPKPVFRWKCYPVELQPPSVRKRRNIVVPNKVVAKKANKDITTKLEELEKKELTEGITPTQKDAAADEADNLEEAQMDDEENDEEENDYGNSYFDNGEDFNDEDDNIDDGPIY